MLDATTAQGAPGGDNQPQWRPDEQHIFVSDLHLGVGDPMAPSPGPAFARFVDDLPGGAGDLGGPRQTILTLLGDTLNLPTAALPSGSDAPQKQRSLAALDELARTHSEVFAALGRFVRRGGRVDVVVGNHDIQLDEPAMFARFREHIISGSDDATAAARNLRLHRWFVYHPEIVYAEHGHQYHDINSVVAPAARCSTDLPLTTLLSVLVGSVRPRGANAALSGTGRAVAIYGATKILGARLAASLPALGSADDRAQAAAIEYGVSRGLTPATVLAIAGLRADPGLGTLGRVGRVLLAPPLRAALPGFASAATVRLLVPRSWGWARRAGTLAGLLGGLVRAIGAIRTPPRASAYMRRAAAAIDEQLHARGDGVAYLIFGHTHVAESGPLVAGGRPALYLNTGSWTSPPASDGGAGIATYSYVRLLVGGRPLTGEASLWQWDDEARLNRPLGNHTA